MACGSHAGCDMLDLHSRSLKINYRANPRAARQHNLIGHGSSRQHTVLSRYATGPI